MSRMDVNVDLLPSVPVENNSSQLTVRPELIPPGPSALPPAPTRNFLVLRGVEIAVRVTPCARVSVHEVAYVPDVALSLRTLAPV